jgi:hypothetical protein
MRSTSKRLAFWSVTGLFAGLMVLSGVLYVSGAAMIRQTMAHLGYPAYVLAILGTAKLLGAAALLQTRWPMLREWAYAGFTINLLGATASHVFSGDPLGVTVTPAIVLFLLSLSYALKPDAIAVAQTRANHATQKAA